jgi:uncharacterized membrane protein YgcG/tetratricopeptide (TPR) repeat protein
MKKSGKKNNLAVLVLALVGAFVGGTYLAVSSVAQEKSSVPARTGYVNDFAGVVDENTKQRLEVVLANFKQRSGIEFDVATVQTTGGKDIFDFSRELAGEWKRGARGSSRKSLLLVIAVNEKTAFTQFSRSVQSDLPEGILGEIGMRMRGPLNAGKFNDGLNDGVSYFINALAKKIGFAVDDLDQPKVATAAAEVTTPVSTSTPAPADSPEAITSSREGKLTVTSPPVKVSKTKPAANKATPEKTANTAEDDADEAEEVELVLTLPLSERVAKLKEFLATYPNSKSRPRAFELLVSTYASLGDLKLKNGDIQGGVEELMMAIGETPANTTDALFSGVIAQIPANLYLRGERKAAYDAAQKIETKFGTDPKRLLVLAGFYLGVEDGVEAARVASQAVKLAPDAADSHRALALGLHLSLRLDEAAAEYKRALELDPNSKKATRRNLADLSRGAGKTESALLLYQQQLLVDPADRSARAGVVLSLFELGRTEEANKELEAALTSDPQNLMLLAGASYWLAAHKNSEKALELAQKAVQLEPRYTWSQIALARALSGQKQPLEAERAMRFAAQYGKFPTLDYELATTLASMGLYDEAADVLLNSFSYKQGQIETLLAGRVAARADSFTELLAPERRASIFQVAGAEREGEASMMKALLAFVAATPLPEQGQLDASTASATAKEFAAGNDAMRAYRELYAANRLVRRDIALSTALELTEAARRSVEAALDVPGATVAVQAEELRDMRARALAQGSTPDVPAAPRNVLANIMRGRVEDLAGMALFNQDKTSEAVTHLRRAVSILPEGTPSWTNALWHLGTALDQAGEKQEALNFYIRSFNSGAPDPVRRGVIEQLYRKTNGSLDGLDDRIGAKIVASNIVPAAIATPAAGLQTPVSSPSPDVVKAAAEPTPGPPQPANPVEPSPSTPSESAPAATPTPESSPVVTATPEPTPEATPVATPTPEATPAATPEATPSPDPSPASSPAAPAASPEPTRATSDLPAAGEIPAQVPSRVKLTGKIKNAAGEAIANVVVVLISPRGTVLSSTTDVDGNYSFIVTPSQLSYRIIPSKDGFSFVPIDKVLTGLSEDQKAVDFVGAAAK